MGIGMQGLPGGAGSGFGLAFFFDDAEGVAAQQEAQHCKDRHHEKDHAVAGQTGDAVQDAAVDGIHEGARQIADEGAQGHGGAGDFAGHLDLVHGGEIDGAHAEDLAFEAGMLHPEDDYSILAEERFRSFFGRHTVQVGSTGNLGLSIGIMSAKLGFKVIVHMSADAKQWKKDLLRSRGVTVVEYQDDYCAAVEQGRKNSDLDPMSYFVDDENSVNLFMGYAVAGKRLAAQLEARNIPVDQDHPLFVYIPCGIGGAPGGVTYGLKQVFGDHVHCFFTEPTQACCMMLGMATGLHDGVSVRDFDISGKTDADGLAVGRPSAFVGRVVEPMLSGIATIDDHRLYDLMRALLDTENTFIEPSSCAAFAALIRPADLETYIRAQGLEDKMSQATHIAWATGGRMVPPEMREEYLHTGL